MLWIRLVRSLELIQNIAFFSSLVCTCYFAQLANAQVTPGTPSFSAYDSHQIDTINLQNLNVMLNPPVFQKSGAFAFRYGLAGDYFIEKTRGTHEQLEFAPSAGPLTGSANNLVPDMTASGSSIAKPYCPNSSIQTDEIGNWQVTSPDGTIHLLPSSDVSDTKGCIYPTFTDQTIDGSGYTVTVKNGALVSIYTKSGILVQRFSATDSNNNSMSDNGGAFTDTLGLTALTLAGTPTTTYSWTDVNGGSPEIAVTNTGVTLKSNFACGSPLDFNQLGSVPTELAYPDGTKLLIAYEPTPGGSSGQYTGRLAQITLRSGGTVQYQYSGGNKGLNCTTGIPPTLKRITSDGTTIYTWSCPNCIGNQVGPSTTTVTDNGGNTTIYTFAANDGPSYPPVLTQVQRFQGSGTLLTTDVYCYNAASGQPGNCTSATVALPITEVDVYHTINGMSTSSRTTTHYDKYGNVTYSAQYDFGGHHPNAIENYAIWELQQEL